MDPRLRHALAHFLSRQTRMVCLTGAGISAESGIPTFRGPEGYWTVGSQEYRPEEMATHAMFRRNPESVWQWYLYRLGVCRTAQPNAAHRALVDVERRLRDRFLIVTQNVDGLHLRAGNTPERVYQIHGNIELMRCSGECSEDIYPIPSSVKPKAKHERLTDQDRTALRCPLCRRSARPHVLWFDEYYDEAHYRYDSSIEAASNAAVLLVIGTSGTTTLPLVVGHRAAEQGALLIDINPERNPFSEMAEQSGGAYVRGSAGEVLGLLAQLLTPT